MQELEDTKHKFDELYHRICLQTFAFKDIRQVLSIYKVNIAFINRIIYTLLIGFLITVIYPLHFLPLENVTQPKIILNINALVENISNLKGVMLILFSVFIFTIILTFQIFLNRMKLKVITYHNICFESEDYGGYTKYF